MAMSHCGVTTLDDEETEPVSTLELYAPTMAQDIIIKIPLHMTTMIYDYFHVVTVSLKLMWFQHKSVVFQL